MSLIGGIRLIDLAGGMHDGVHAVEFKTGSGLNYMAVPSRGLDITIAEHNGRSLALRLVAREVNQHFMRNLASGG